jgi:hypothetical protein
MRTGNAPHYPYPLGFRIAHLIFRALIALSLVGFIILIVKPQNLAASLVRYWLWASLIVFPMYLLLEHLVMKSLVRRGRKHLNMAVLERNLNVDGLFVLIYVMILLGFPLLFTLLFLW